MKAKDKKWDSVGQIFEVVVAQSEEEKSAHLTNNEIMSKATFRFEKILSSRWGLKAVLS